MKNLLKKLKNKNIHIVGVAGAEGSAIVEFLIKQKITTKITGHDFSSLTEFKKAFESFHESLGVAKIEQAYKNFKKLQIKINYRDTYLQEIEKADIVFVPQSWFLYQYNFPKLQKIKDSGIPFLGIMNLYFDLISCPIIGITGTSGKSTTSRLVYEIFSKSPIKTYFAGNDRQNVQVLNQISKITVKDVLILEISDRQLLLNFNKSPHIATITNLSINHHLDDYLSFNDYILTKRKIVEYQKADDFAILNADNKITEKLQKNLMEKFFYLVNLKK